MTESPVCRSTPPTPPTAWWRPFVVFMRRWSGDDAYERYVAAHREHDHTLLSKREFYRRYLDKRGSGGRCC